MVLYDVRRWLEEAIKAKGGEVTGAGMVMQEERADVSFMLHGVDYWLDLKPIGAEGEGSESD